MNNTEKAYCRLCAVCKPLNKLLDIQSNLDQGERIINKLTVLNCQLDFNEYNMPKTVCLLCVNTLTSAFDFVIAVERAQVVLKNIVSSESIKKEVDSSDSESMVYDTQDNYCNNVTIKSEPVKEDTSSKPPIVLKKVKALDKSEDKKDLSDLDSIPLSQLKLTWKDYIWTCAYCEYQFPNIEELNHHSIEYHKACNAYRCTDCNIKKLRLDRFLTHVRSHRKYLQMSCYKCFKTFSSNQVASRHKVTHIKTDFKCNGCNTCFPSLEELEKHSSVFYKDLRSRNIPIQAQTDSLNCPICKKDFKTKTSLNTHLLIHTDRKRDHTCEVCGKCFWQKQTLAGHMMLHEDKRPFHCEICKLSFRTKNHLRTHVGVHDGEKPFSCDQCGKCFRLKKQLVSHSIIHTDSLPHICSFCNKGFRFRTILNQHIRQHTGVKPYSCNICGRDFTNWPNYNKHMKRRHSMDMAKKKHTPDGVYPIDPITGKVVYPEMDKMLEWKNKILEQTKPGRPRIKATIEDANGDILVPTENIKTEESNDN